MIQKVTIGFLGCGNVGSGVWRLLEGFASDIAHRAGLTFYIKKVLVRSLNKQRDITFPKGVLTTDPEDVLDDPEIQMVVEFLGGEQPAYTYMLHALKAGKPLLQPTRLPLRCIGMSCRRPQKIRSGAVLRGGRMRGHFPSSTRWRKASRPTVYPRCWGLSTAPRTIYSPVMSKENADYNAVLKDAQRLGLAEPDPSSDVEGLDAAYKLSILAPSRFMDAFVEDVL